MALTPRELTERFEAQFGGDGQLAFYRAPGRVNMMGEHTDYNLGLVCPMALEMACYAACAPSEHGTLHVFSGNLNESRKWPVADIDASQPEGDWGDYVLGVAVQLARAGYQITPTNLYLESDVPGGAGLSSSAAIEVATALGLLDGRAIDKLELAKLCQRAESQFVGMPCGIMDQYASVFGQQESAIQIDCRSLESRPVHLPAELAVIVTNSLVKHELGTSAYRQRVAECQEAVAAIRKINEDVHSLRDVSLRSLDQIHGSIPTVPRKRARHIVTDNMRVLDFAAAASAGDLREMGRLFIASHRSAQYDYEISCEELDFLVDTAITIDGAYGSRMTGGGFGGCTVSLVAPAAVSMFREQVTRAYKARYNITPLFYECVPAAGAGKLEA